VLKTPINAAAPDWSRDGQYVAFTDRSSQTGADLWVVPIAGDRVPSAFLQTPADEAEPHFLLTAAGLPIVRMRSGGLKCSSGRSQSQPGIITSRSLTAVGGHRGGAETAESCSSSAWTARSCRLKLIPPKPRPHRAKRLSRISRPA
jgi:hypothetical protein